MIHRIQKVKAIQSFVMQDREPVQVGEEIEVPASLARDLIAANKAEKVLNPEEQKAKDERDQRETDLILEEAKAKEEEAHALADQARDKGQKAAARRRAADPNAQPQLTPEQK